MLGIVLNALLMWLVMYYVLGIHTVPDFKPLILVLFILSIITTIIYNIIGAFAIIPNIIIFSGAIKLIYKLDNIETLKIVGIYQALKIIFYNCV